MDPSQPNQSGVPPVQPQQPSFSAGPQPSFNAGPPLSPQPPRKGLGWLWHRLSIYRKAQLIVFAVLLVLAIIAGLSHRNHDTTAGVSINPFVSSSAQHGVALTATDFAAVCTGSKFSNAASYDKTTPGPHTIKAFIKSDDGKNYIPSVLYLGPGVTPVTGTPGDIQLVLCVKPTGNSTLLQTCTLHDDTENKDVSVKVMGTDYQLNLYAAKTGQKVGSTVVSKYQTGCPYSASIDPSNPTYYQQPDQTALQDALKQYVQ